MAKNNTIVFEFDNPDDAEAVMRCLMNKNEIIFNNDTRVAILKPYQYSMKVRVRASEEYVPPVPRIRL